jgi:PAS domain S-box-containing protein
MVAALLAVWGWRRRSTAGALPFTVLMTAVAFWAQMSALTHSVDTFQAKLFWVNMQYLGVTAVPAAWLAFVLHYTGRERWLTWRSGLLLAIEPLLVQVFAWTNPYHHLFRIQVGLDTSQGIPVLKATFGPAFWIHTGYSYILMLLATYLLIQAHRHSPRMYRRQTIALLVAVLAPWLANAISIFKLSPFPNLDLTPFAFTITGLFTSWGLLRFQLLDIVPIAWDAVVEGMNDGVIVLDPKDRVVAFNPVARRLLKHASDDIVPEDVIGYPLQEVLPVVLEVAHEPDDGPDDSAQERQAEVPLEVEGDQRVYDVRISSLYDRRGRPRGGLLVLRDITDRKQAEAALNRYARRLRVLHEMSVAVNASLDLPEVMDAACQKLVESFRPVDHSGLGILDEQHTYLEIQAEYPHQGAKGRRLPVQGNRATERVLESGHPLAIYDAQHDPLMEKVWETMQALDVRSTLIVPILSRGQVIGTLGLDAIQAPHHFTDAESALVQTVAAQLGVAIENARLYTAAQQELRERQAVEAALRESEAALRQYAADLEAQNAELDAFAHTVAHDLKTPLTVLIAAGSMLARHHGDMPDERLAQYAAAIGQHGRRMSNIIDELLLLASVRKVEEIQVRPLDMDGILAEVRLRLGDMIAERDAELHMPKTWPSALGYGPWIEEVWVNYLSNAIKYGGEPPRAELGGELVRRDGAMIARFWVRDNGDGLTPEQQARLFAPFERLEQVRVEGHGLGLSIVRRIIEKLGGEVGVESRGEPGAGSTFYFTLPQAEA